MQLLNKRNGSSIKVKILTAFERYFKTTLLCYYIKSSKYKYKEVFPIQVASSISQLSDISCDASLLQNAIKRFESGHQLFYCCDNGVLVGYGWRVVGVLSYYAWEIASDICFKQSVDVLYDFFVNKDYRKRGIYKSLLHFIINNSEDNSILAIYAEASNIPSIKAIISCGFRFVSKLTHFSNKIMQM